MIHKIKVSPSLVILIVICFVLDTYANLFAFLISAAIHEFGHLMLAKIKKIKIDSLELSIFGASIKAQGLPCSYGDEALLALAGPAANFLSALLCIPLALWLDCEFLKAFCAASVGLAIVNLLPIKSFDGGRVLSSILLQKSSQRTAHCVLEITSFLFLFLIWSISVYFIIRAQSCLPLFVFSGAVFLRMFVRER